MSDLEAVIRQLDELRHRTDELRALWPISEERLASDIGFAAMVERHLQIATQAAIDVGAWVIAEQVWREPRNYADVFYVLADQGFLDRPTAYRLAEMAEYRNVLVHVYTGISHQKTARFATEGLEDLAELAARFAAEYSP